MSLLLEALKKAELAKHGQVQEEAAATSQAPEPLDFPRVELMLEEPEPEPVLTPAPTTPRQPVITRESLPDISQPLEIRSEDLAEYIKEPVARPRAPAAEPPPAPPQEVERPIAQRTVAEPPEPPPAAADAQQQRDAARQMFEVNEVEYNPRRPFYFTVAGLITAGACYGGYVWWQMQPHYAVNTAAVKAPAPAAAPVAVAQAARVPADPAPEATPPAAANAANQNTAPSAPNAASAAATSRRSADAVNPETRAPAPLLRPTAAIAAADAASPARANNATPRGAARPDAASISVTPAVAQVDPGIERAYGLYQRGDADGARIEYQRAIERDPLNRDALLGLAALDVRSRNYETAELRYLKLLELNPRDTYAMGALIGLQGNVDPVQSESRIKSLIASQPDATHLYFTLGNLYGSQSHWPEAQDAYFKAYSADPENADYAYNLAVSLDQLRQRKPAAEYYRKAAALAAQRPSAFDRNRAEARARELDR